ncbi:MAG: ribbon-helix-helix protein, CopG family [Bifidobacteriaceae bacterium]|jgi:hypothetical protein|nr:ribbon-helix-helix protein, CopG family [Bifidobacteriaceae bacterium]MCI1914820.1 ribbon-helix-helix protein, CopG family [Bifidobacteriaceae bacterium]
MTVSKRDKDLLTRFGMTTEQVESNSKKAESETAPDEMTGRVHYGLHLEDRDEEMVSVSLRLPKSTLNKLNKEARRYHISRSEYMRRRLANA